MPPTTTVVFLVHGTWGRGLWPRAPWRRSPNYAPWVEDEAPIPRAIKSALGPGTQLRRLQWSGRNRHRDRSLATAALRRELIASRRKHPHAPHHVVGHSHGGNVAIRAQASALEGFRWDRIVCVATPVITLRRRRLRPFTLLYWLLGSLAFFTPWLWLPLTCSQHVLTRPFARFCYEGVPSSWAFAASSLLVVPWIWMLGLTFVLGTAHGALPHLRGTVMDAPPHGVLLFRRSNDEASLVLYMAAIGEWLARLLVRFSRFVLLPVASLLVIIVALLAAWGAVDVFVVGSSYPGWVSRLREIAGVAVVVLLFGSLAAAAVSLLALAVPSFALGLDGPAVSLWYDVSVDETPTGEHTVVRVDPQTDPARYSTTHPAVPSRLLRALSALAGEMTPDRLTHSDICWDAAVAARIAEYLAGGSHSSTYADPETHGRPEA